ncbi:MAG: hypothetical protein HY290_16525 [Planctomycetia bacterium]|nr:hypothetical protein [Planctomycetia bacterium]
MASDVGSQEILPGTFANDEPFVRATIPEPPPPLPPLREMPDAPDWDVPRESSLETDRAPVKACRDGTARIAPDGEGDGTAEEPRKPGLSFFYGRELRYMLCQTNQSTDWSMPKPEADYRKRVILDWGCDVTETPVSWLWPGRIPLGRLKQRA